MWFKTILRRSRTVLRQRGDSGAEGAFKADEALLRRLERLALQANRALLGSPNNGEHPSRQRLPASIMSDHRPYSHGDDYRAIDWNAYARHEQVVVKLGEAEQDVHIHVLVDCSRSMQFGTPSKLVAAQNLAAAIGYVALAHSDRLRLVPFSAGPIPAFGPASGKGRAFEMLSFVGAFQPAGETQLLPTLQRYARQHERGGLLVIASDLLTAPADSLAEALRAFAPPRWQVLVAHVLDRGELAPQIGTLVDLEDAETGEVIAMSLDEPTLAAYRRNVFAWQEQLQAACAKRGATYVQVFSDSPFEQSVIPYLRLRQVLQ